MSAAEEKAVSDLVRFAESFSGVLAVAKRLKDIGSVDQAAAEAEARNKKAEDNILALQNQIGDMQASAEWHEKDTADRIAKAKAAAEAAEMKRQNAETALQATVDKILAAATAKASEIVADAEGEADHIKAVAQDVANEMDAGTAEVANRRSAIEAEVRALTDQRDALRKDLDAIRKRAASLSGG